MKKSSLLLIVIIIASVVLMYNSLKMAEPPEIIIMADDIQIGYVVGLNMWNRAVYDRECILKQL